MKAETIIGPVKLVDLPYRTYVGIRIQTPFAGMFAVAGKALNKLRAWSKANSVQDEGPYILRYYHCNMKDVMAIEAGFLTTSNCINDPDIRSSFLPAGRYASLVYRGNGLRGNQAMMKWAQETGTILEPIDPGVPETYICRYEAYMTDYRIEPRKLLWDIELSIKIAE